jgi:exodeoxyribonuclease VII small subunit
MEFESFESALEYLKNIIKKFEENENISIEELLNNYEEGMKAYSFCEKKLKETQKKIKIIDENFDRIS